MNDASADGSDISERVLLLFEKAIKALTAKDGTVTQGGDAPTPSLFPRGIGGISVSLTMAGATASIAISSPPPISEELNVFREGPPPHRPPPPPPNGHVHPMVIARADNSKIPLYMQLRVEGGTYGTGEVLIADAPNETSPIALEPPTTTSLSAVDPLA